jgi:uncharacterized protein (TIGR01777 family)
MNILVVGGRGFIGSALCSRLRDGGHKVTVTTRRKTISDNEITWSPPELIAPEILSRFDGVVNLAGESIVSYWTKDKKERILSSRTDTTRSIVVSMANADSRPKVLVSASAIGYYGPHDYEPVTEDTQAASDFLADVCVKWEAEAYKAEALGVRVVTVRIGGVLDADGGALPQMVTPFKFFLGGPIGSGKQWFSWIHRDDVVGMMQHAIENDSVSGPINATAPHPVPINATAPHPVTNREFSDALGKVLNRPSCLAVPGFVVKLTLGELGAILLTGQKVIPEKALATGYKFKYSDVTEALRAIFNK